MKEKTGAKSRYSFPREVVLNVLCSCSDHPDAETVYNRAREIKPDISRGTVYRNLKFLGDENKILTLETEKNRLHYDGNIQPHMHFICNDCGEITDLFVKAQIPEELSAMGYIVTDEKCIYYGYCKKCQQKKII